ncbi:MAG: ABC transporter permease [Pseudonocardiaceae bacterium]
MLRFTVRRVLQLAVVVAVLSVLIFAWLRALPGGPVAALLGDRGTPESRAQLAEALGLNDPIPVQYFSFVGRAITGDFGVSTGVSPGRPAMELFLERFPATIELSVAAIVIALAGAIPLGYLAARRRGGWLDNVGVVGSMIGISIPIFFLAFLLKYVVSIKLGLLPTGGRQDVGIDATRVTGFFVLDGVLTGEWDAAVDALEHLLLPGLALASIPFAVVFRITRAAVLDVMDEDYVRTARAKGLTQRVIRDRHVLRNALLPVTTTIGLQTGALLSGAVLTETVFAWQGVGQALAIGFERKDFPVLQVVIVAAAMAYVLVNLIVDLSYAVIDPRIRTAQGGR